MELTIDLRVFVGSGNFLSVLISLLNKQFCKQSVQTHKLVHLGQLAGWKGARRLIGLLKKLANHKYNQHHENEFSLVNL